MIREQEFTHLSSQLRRHQGGDVHPIFLITLLDDPTALAQHGDQRTLRLRKDRVETLFALIHDFADSLQ